LEPGKPYVWIDPEGNPHVKTKAKPKGGQ
jgi:hypothetical protein